jgi:hypothetical protein
VESRADEQAALRERLESREWRVEKEVGSARVGPCCLTKEATLGDLRYATTRHQPREGKFHAKNRHGFRNRSSRKISDFRLPIGDLIIGFRIVVKTKKLCELCALCG